MAGASPNQDIFDVRKVRRLVELMKEHELNEIDLRQGDMRIQLRRGMEPKGTHPVGPPAPAPAPASPPPSTAAVQPPERPAAAAAEADPNVKLITSPIVGTYYSAPDPESPPFVNVGDHVGPETTVCIVEAMKVFNEIPAEISGKVVAILVENGEPVEFGQPLFKVDPSQ